MKLSQGKIIELQNLYKQEYGVSLSAEEAYEYGSFLIGILQATYEPENL